jgi:hypothetical protein
MEIHIFLAVYNRSLNTGVNNLDEYLNILPKRIHMNCTENYFIENLENILNSFDRSVLSINDIKVVMSP